MKTVKRESGEVMIEGMIVMIITLFILIWILGLGFLYYQRYLVTAVTNDVAHKIASTYHNPDSDIVMGYIEAEDLADRDLYRLFEDNSLFEMNKLKAKAYVEHQLNKTNFAGTLDDVQVQMKMVQDSPFRKHIEITTVCAFSTPFGEGLGIFGMDGLVKYQTIARAECTDIADYLNTVEFSHRVLSGDDFKSRFIDFINAMVTLCNHQYAAN